MCQGNGNQTSCPIQGEGVDEPQTNLMLEEIEEAFTSEGWGTKVDLNCPPEDDRYWFGSSGYLL